MLRKRDERPKIGASGLLAKSMPPCRLVTRAGRKSGGPGGNGPALEYIGIGAVYETIKSNKARSGVFAQIVDAHFLPVRYFRAGYCRQQRNQPTYLLLSFYRQAGFGAVGVPFRSSGAHREGDGALF